MSKIDLNFKQKLLAYCLRLVMEKIIREKALIDDLQEQVKLETKGSAGDKYETTKADLQNNVEKVAIQLAESLKQKTVLEQIDINRSSKSISIGSLIDTDKGWFFFAIPLGKIKFQDSDCIVLSLISPLGQAFKGKHVTDQILFRNQNYTIKQIV